MSHGNQTWALKVLEWLVSNGNVEFNIRVLKHWMDKSNLKLKTCRIKVYGEIVVRVTVDKKLKSIKNKQMTVEQYCEVKLRQNVSITKSRKPMKLHQTLSIKH